MENWNSNFEFKNEGQNNANSVWIAENLKCCPLCGAVNAMSNGECFVCGWYGAFEHEPSAIEHGVNELIARSQELDQAIENSDWIPMSQSERIRAFLRKIFWPVD